MNLDELIVELEKLRVNDSRDKILFAKVYARIENILYPINKVDTNGDSWDAWIELDTGIRRLD